MDGYVLCWISPWLEWSLIVCPWLVPSLVGSILGWFKLWLDQPLVGIVLDWIIINYLPGSSFSQTCIHVEMQFLHQRFIVKKVDVRSSKKNLVIFLRPLLSVNYWAYVDCYNNLYRAQRLIANICWVLVVAVVCHYK